MLLPSAGTSGAAAPTLPIARGPRHSGDDTEPVDRRQHVVGNDREGKGGESFEAPTYACRPPGVHHGPFKSERGCLLYEIHYYDESGKQQR